MIIKKINLKNGAGKSVKTSRFLGIALLACMIAILGNSACKKAEEGVESGEETIVALKEGIIPFEGTAAVTYGKFLYVPEAQGFDIVVQGSLNSGDLSTLIDKEIRGEGEFTPDFPSILVATTLEVKDESGGWSPVFTKTEDVVLDDYLDLQAREAYPTLLDIAYNKNEGWEGFENVKVQGILEELDGVYKLAVFNSNDQEEGKILVDSISDFAQYYINKLGLFERFWFYVTVKDTVAWNLRRTSRDLFHADILFAGLF
ncbi:hypothetical protein ACFLQZ_04565 [Acidobacteriota bacterium]